MSDAPPRTAHELLTWRQQREAATATAATTSTTATIPLRTLLSRLATRNRRAIHELLTGTDSADRTNAAPVASTLMAQLARSRRELLRALVAVRWMGGERAETAEFYESLSTYAVATTIRHPREAADQLYWVQSICQQARVPRFDVRVAADVLLAGRYRGLPMCVEEIGESRDVDDAYATASDDHLHSVTRQLDVELLHSFLSIVDRVPEAFRKSATIKDGVLTVRVEHEFELTVSMRGDVVVGDVAAEASDIAAAASSRTWLWVPLRLRMLVPRKRRMSTVAKHDVSSEPLLNDHQMHAVLGMLHDFAIYPHKENPFPSLYEFLHDLALRMALEELHLQAVEATTTTWKNVVVCRMMESDVDEAASGSGPQQLQVAFWGDNFDGDNTFHVHINNEKLVSTTPIISTRPSSTTPTHHNLSLSNSLNFERVLLSSIHARTHEKLESLQALLVFDGIYTDGFRLEHMFFRKDVRLRRSDDNTPEADGTTDHFQGSSMLVVRMVSTTPPDYVAISVDIKNGRFVLALSSAEDAGSSGGGDRALSLARAEREINADVRNCRDVLVELRCMIALEHIAHKCSYFGLRMLQPSPRFTESSQLEFESTYAVFLEFGRAHTDWLIAIEMVASDGDLRDGMTSTYRDAYAVSLLEVRLTQQATGRVYEVMNKCLAGAVAGPDLFSDVIGTMRPFVDSFRQNILVHYVGKQFQHYGITYHQKASSTAVELIIDVQNLPRAVRCSRIRDRLLVDIDNVKERVVATSTFGSKGQSLMLTYTNIKSAVDMLLRDLYTIAAVVRFAENVQAMVARWPPTARKNLEVRMSALGECTFVFYQKYAIHLRWRPDRTYTHQADLPRYCRGEWLVSLTPDDDSHPLYSIRHHLQSVIAGPTPTPPASRLLLLYRLFQILGFLGKLEQSERAKADNLGMVVTVVSRSAKDHRIKVTYRQQQYAVDLRLLSAEFFIMADAAMLPLDLGMPRSDAKMVPPPFSAIPGFPAVIHTLPRDLRVKYDKNSTRIASAPHDMSTAVTPLDTKLRVLPTPGMALVGGVGVDCWVVRDAILAVLKGITGVLK